MKKIFIVCIFLVFYVTLSFSNYVTMPKGTYIFKTEKNEVISFIVQEKTLKSITENGFVTNFKMFIDGPDYIYIGVKDNGEKIILVFVNSCEAILLMSDTYFLENVKCKRI